MTTDRLIALYKILADGAARMDELRSLMEEERYKMSEGALRKILQKAKTDGYVASMLYKNPARTGIFALYALTDAAAEILCQESGYRVEGIRKQLPPRHYLEHDKQVRRVFRAVRKEGMRLGLEVTMADEYYLRFPIKGFPKKKPLPDMYLCYAKDPDLEDTYDIEVDNSTTPVRKLYSKSIELPHRVLLLSPSKGRIEMLISSFSKFWSFLSKTKNPLKIEPAKKIYFATIDDFCKYPVGGVYGTVWKTMEGTPIKLASKFIVR